MGRTTTSGDRARTRLGTLAAALLAAGAIAVAAPVAAAEPLTQAQVEQRVQAGATGMSLLSESFPGTRLARRSGTKVRVLVADLAPSVVVQGQTPLRLLGGGAPPADLVAGHRYEVRRAGPAWSVTDLDDPASPVRSLKGPRVRFSSRGAPTGLLMADPLGRRYRGDLVLVRSAPGTMGVVNTVPIEGWVAGVLAGEVPSGWLDTAPSALWASAVLARSRGLKATTGARRSSYDLTSDDPTYHGIDGERPAALAAVRRSKGMAILASGRPLDARFDVVAGISSEFQPEPGDPDPVAEAPAKPIAGAPKGAGAKALRLAVAQTGTPYVWGGSRPGGFDCSGLVYWVYQQFGITLPRVAEDQARVGYPVARDELMPGDAVFFADSSGYIHHMGLYVGNGTMVHAPQTGDVVKLSRIDSGYYASQYAGARRYSPVG